MKVSYSGLTVEYLALAMSLVLFRDEKSLEEVYRVTSERFKAISFFCSHL
jgi:hypothetical protein